MVLKERINIDFTEAYKNKNIDKKNFLGVLKGAIQTQEGKMIQSTDENVLKVIKSLEKGLKETIESLKLQDADTATAELELSYLKPYMSEMMDESVIRELVRQIIVNNSSKNVGAIMGTFMKENGRSGLAFDAKAVSNIIKEEIV